MKVLVLTGLSGSLVLLVALVLCSGACPFALATGGAPAAQPVRVLTPKSTGVDAPLETGPMIDPGIPVETLRQQVEVLDAIAGLSAQLGALDARVVALGDELARQTPQRVTGFPPARETYTQALQRKPNTDWSALEILSNDYGIDAAATQRSVSFLTPHELLARFGSPTRVGAEEGRVRWIYRGDARQLTVMFYLHGDYVTEVRIFEA